MTTNKPAGMGGDAPAMDMTITLSARLVERIARARVLGDDGMPLETIADKVETILFDATDETLAGQPVPKANEMGPPVQLKRCAARCAARSAFFFACHSA